MTKLSLLMFLNSYVTSGEKDRGEVKTTRKDPASDLSQVSCPCSGNVGYYLYCLFALQLKDERGSSRGPAS